MKITEHFLKKTHEKNSAFVGVIATTDRKKIKGEKDGKRINSIIIIMPKTIKKFLVN